MFNSKILNSYNDFLQYDMAYERHFKSKLKKAESDIKDGRVMTIAESKERMRRQYENFNV